MLARHHTMRMMRADGMTFAEIADHFGITKQRVHQVAWNVPVDASKIARRPHPRRSNILSAHKKSQHRDAVAELWVRGLTSGQISLKLGISRSAVMGLVWRMRRRGDARVSPRKGGE